MKILFAIVALLTCFGANAGDFGYYSYRIDTYDPVTGLYYASVENAADGRKSFLSSSNNLIVNVNIFDPATNSSTPCLKSRNWTVSSFSILKVSTKKAAWSSTVAAASAWQTTR